MIRAGGIFFRFDGRGFALYAFTRDRPGVILCQNVDEFGGTWLVVRASGKLVR